jgi:uncharacterized membrane protein (UPF0127 family)
VRHAQLIHNGNDIAMRVSVAESARERMVGLLGRDSLESNEALWLQPCRSIHTFGMRFPVDVLFVDQAGCVVAVHREVGCARLLFSLRGRTALEMQSGIALRHSIQVGDQLAFEPLR